jgi:hypothetical protein
MTATRAPNFPSLKTEWRLAVDRQRRHPAKNVEDGWISVSQLLE